MSEIKGTFRMIGRTGVDSGQVIVTDPCYFGKFVDDEFTGVGSGDEGEFSYSGACRTTLNEVGGGELGGALAVVSATAYGDGVYRVFQVLDEDGTITGLFVDFTGKINSKGEIVEDSE
jgi:hypothetical protein